MGSLAVYGVEKPYQLKRSAGEVRALSEVSFQVHDGEFCSILGHSGCGKSTLLYMIAGFEKPNRGSLLVDGEPIKAPNWDRTIVFQDYALFPWATVAQNIAFGLEMKGEPPEKRRQVVEHYIGLVGLGGFEHRFPHELSGGMQQRVAIARALAVNPQLLLMDEPFAALDAQTRDRMQDELVKIWQAERKTVIFITHSIEEAIRLSDRIIVFTRRPGRVKANLSVTLPRPRSEEDPEVIALRRQIRDLIAEEQVEA